MADVTLTPASVVPGDGAQYQNALAGVALAAGDVVALDTTTQHAILATSATVTGARVRGIAACSAAPGQPVRIITGGVVNLGAAVLSIGELYALSGLNPGKLGPLSDVGAGDFVTVLGVGQSTSLLQMRLWTSDIAKA